LATRPLGAKSLAGSEVSCMVGLHRTASQYRGQQATASTTQLLTVQHGAKHS
jgi:hypothetical protein